MSKLTRISALPLVRIKLTHCGAALQGYSKTARMDGSVNEARRQDDVQADLCRW